jgi:hypothetical protein
LPDRRHSQVADQHIRTLREKRFHRRAGVVRCGDDGAHTLQHHRQDTAGVGLVIYDETCTPSKTNRRTAVGDVAGTRRFVLGIVVDDRFLVALRWYPHRMDGETHGKRRTFLSPGLVASTVPPCASTMYLTIESPKPIRRTLAELSAELETLS